MITTAIIEWAEAQKRRSSPGSKITVHALSARVLRPKPKTSFATTPCSIPSLLFARGGYPRDVNAGF